MQYYISLLKEDNWLYILRRFSLFLFFSSLEIECSSWPNFSQIECNLGYEIGLRLTQNDEKLFCVVSYFKSSNRMLLSMYKHRSR